MTKILIHSNAPWVGTGYGQQTGLFAPRLKDSGYEVAVSSFYGLEGNMIGWKGIPVLPGLGGTFGNESLPGHANAYFGGFRDGLVLTLMDVWVLNIENIQKMNVASWTPVDHDPLPPAIERYFKESGAIPIAMSRFGEERLAEFDPLYVPHAVDTEVYRPMDEPRKAAGVSEDAFVVGIVAANKGNPSRKAFVQSMMAFKAFRERHDDAVLALHTELKAPNGIDLIEQVERLGLQDCVQPSEQYSTTYLPLPGEAMATMYSSFDVLLNPAMGEGFGIPVIEAQACGTPVIVTDFSAMSELVGAGWKVESTPHLTGQMAWQREPDIEDIVESLEQAYAMGPNARKSLSEKARKFAGGYDVEMVLRHCMLPALKEVEERIGKPNYADRTPQEVARAAIKNAEKMEARQ